MFSHIQQINRFIHQAMLQKAEKRYTSMQAAWKNTMRAAICKQKNSPTQTSAQKVNEIKAKNQLFGNRR